MARSFGATTANTGRHLLPTAQQLAETRAAGQDVEAAASGLQPTRVRPSWPTPMGALGQASGQELVDASCSVLPRSTAAMDKRARSVHRFVEYLQGFPGHSWQQRWLASGGDTAAASLARLNPAVDSWSMTRGFSWLAAMRVVAPSVAALRSSSVADYFTVFSACQHDELLARLQKAVDAAPASPIYRYRACNELAYALTSQAITLAELTPSGFLQFGVEHRAASRTREDRYPGTLLWPLLADGGYFPPGTPATLRAATSGSRRSIVELVDRYDVREKAVRELLVDYISHRAAAGMDASTTSSLVRTLVRNFWCVIERVNPDQRDLAVDEATYLAWRREVDVVIDHNGMARPRQSIWDLLIAVRALYLDLQSWAVEDPARWARWVAPCPIPPMASRGYAAGRRELSARMADRTRLRQPLLELLVDHVHRRREHTRKLLSIAAAAPAETVVTVDGDSYTVLPPPTPRAPSTRAVRKGPRVAGVEVDTPPARDRIVRVRELDGEVIDVAAAEERAFWAWAIVGVLRHSGIRHEELLELSHLSIRQYRRPNGELVGLLVIAPSKTDKERVLPISPELLHVLAEILRRHQETVGGLSLARRWDPHEREHSARLPFLFQHTLGPVRRVLSSATVAELLRNSCQAAAVHHRQFDGIVFTPHDFRRIFATEAVNNGLPIHIGAALLGHSNLQTTRGYVAVFDEDVVRHYQAYLAARRGLRPQEEYRAVTHTEWGDFEKHFDTRKVELGACARPYGTPCAHEHACVRCPMLNVAPTMLARLDDLETDLLGRRDRATREGWSGSVTGTVFPAVSISRSLGPASGRRR